MLRAKQAFQKRGPCSDERPERWGTWDRCVRPSVCMFVCRVAYRENAGDPNLGILKSAWTDYPSSKAVDDSSSGCSSRRVVFCVDGGLETRHGVVEVKAAGCWP